MGQVIPIEQIKEKVETLKRVPEGERKIRMELYDIGHRDGFKEGYLEAIKKFELKIKEMQE